MDMLNDPSMREIVIDFCEESKGLFAELEVALENLEDDVTKTAHLEEFGQIIDRVMGAAKSIGLERVSMFCELGKIIGYKSSQVKDTNLLEVIVAVLFDTVDLLKKMINRIEAGNTEDLENLNTKAFGTRLHWVSDKLKDIDRSSCDYGVNEDDNMNQNSIDDLLSGLGL